jgi:hypothetical protein
MRERTLNFKSLETSSLTGWMAGGERRSITEAITEALRERLDRFEGRPNRAGTRAAVARFQDMVVKLSELDDRPS